MLLGYNTNGFSSHSLEDALRVLGGLGYRSIAITLDHHALNPYAAGFDEALERCRHVLWEQRLTPVIETGARFLLDPWRKHRPTLIDEDEEERAVRREFLEKAIDIAHHLGARVVSLWSGSTDDAASPGELDERLADQLRALCQYAAERSVVIGFEPEPGMHIESMADFARISAAVGHPAFQLTLDVGHAHLTEPEGAAEAVRRWRDRIVNVQLEGMARPIHDHLLHWEGDMDLRDVFAALVEIGYDGPAAFELSRHSHNAVAVARRAIEFAFEAGAVR
jgi:L-ribulose-5-phosphate 3-epimerase